MKEKSLRITSKERETNNFRFLTASFVAALHFKNPYVARLYAVFKAQINNKISYPRTESYSFRVPNIQEKTTENI